MTPDDLEYVRKTWPRWRGRINWRYQDRIYIAEPPKLLGADWTSGYVPEATQIKRFLVTAESVGWNHHDDVYEWWNIICDGRIIDMEWHAK